MAGYTPVFDSVFQGSLCGKYPDLAVWLVLLALQQRGGVIDAHPSYIATISGLPQADIEASIARFCLADPSSRSKAEDGRRLIPIPNAGFGWIVVNHRQYREKARKAAYEAEGLRSPRTSAQSRAHPPSEAEAKADSEAEVGTLRSSSSESVTTVLSDKRQDVLQKAEKNKAALRVLVSGIGK